MLMAHKFMDALLGGKHPVLESPLANVTPERARLAAGMIKHAQKFDFGVLTLEKDNEVSGAWRIPQLTGDELEWWRQGLIPLPYPICWYEFVIGGWRSGMLVYEGEGPEAYWRTERLEYLHNINHIMYDGLVSRCNRHQVVMDANTESTMEGSRELCVEVEGDVDVLRHLAQPGLRKFLNNNLTANVPLSIYLTLMLNSKTTEVTHAVLPEKLVKKQMKKGRTPLPPHRIVTIVPQRFRGMPAAEPGGGTHRSPRLHWRRSHLRRYKGSKVVIPKQADPAQAIREALTKREGSAAQATAWVEFQANETTTTYLVDYQVVIARMLVGKAELGEVSHEYKIEPLKEVEHAE